MSPLPSQLLIIKLKTVRVSRKGVFHFKRRQTIFFLNLQMNSVDQRAKQELDAMIAKAEYNCRKV